MCKKPDIDGEVYGQCHNAVCCNFPGAENDSRCSTSASLNVWDNKARQSFPNVPPSGTSLIGK